MKGPFHQFISYFPVRYYAVAILFGWVFLQGYYQIQAIIALPTVTVLSYVQIPASSLAGQSLIDQTQINPPTLLQILFFTFFATVAVCAKTNLRRRLGVLLFGAFAVGCFMALELITTVGLYKLGILDSKVSLNFVNIIGTILLGAASIHLALFTNITIPARTVINPVLKKRRAHEYAYLFTVVALSSSILYAISWFLYLGLDTSSILSDFVSVYLWLGIFPVINMSYWVANLVHRILAPGWIRKTKPVQRNRNIPPLSVTFLVPAYNEERLIGRCIQSIDKAAAKYAGKVEIVVVNDGSTDRTQQVATDAVTKIGHATGTVYSIPNSGKGYALSYGLEKIKSDIVFRTDADSLIDENALSPMINRFSDPSVGCVCAWTVPLSDGKGVWVKTQFVRYTHAFYIRRAQELFDGLLIPPGSSTAFRRSTLEVTGGWMVNMFGEDSEIANRIARYGYRIAYEPDAIVYSEVPMTLKGVMQQRARWGIAFYQSRGRNWRLARALWTPRSLFYQGEVLSHAARFAQNMAYPVMAALAITIGLGIQSVSPYGDLLDFPGLTHAALVLGLKITTISALYSSLQLILFGYKLNKIGILSAIVCYPCVLIVDILVTSMIRPIIMNALLEWSVKWNSNKNLTQSFRALRRVANRVDPLYPAGDDSSAGIHSPEDSHKTAATNN